MTKLKEIFSFPRPGEESGWWEIFLCESDSFPYVSLELVDRQTDKILKGMAFPPAAIPKLAEGLNRAVRELQKRGILKPE